MATLKWIKSDSGFFVPGSDTTRRTELSSTPILDTTEVPAVFSRH